MKELSAGDPRDSRAIRLALAEARQHNRFYAPPYMLVLLDDVGLLWSSSTG